MGMVDRGMTDTRRRTAATSAETGPIFGEFHYVRGRQQLIWSDSVYSIFGFESGQIVPTWDIMSFHQIPQDRPRWDTAVQRIRSDGRPFSLWHHITDAHLSERTLQTTAVSTVDDAGTVVEIRGVVTDISDRLRDDRAAEVDKAVARSAATRSVIDQAKGILMAVLDVDHDQAFDLLRWHSSYNNIKIRDLAAVILDRLADPAVADAAPRQRLASILAALGDERQPPLPIEHAADPIAPPPPTRSAQTAAVRHIAESELPQTMVRAVAGAAQSISIADCQTTDWPLVYVNTAFETLTGYPADEILGRNCRFLQGADTGTPQAVAIHRALAAGAEIKTVLRNFRKDGTPFWNELHLAAVRDAAGEVTHYIGYQADVSERVEREQQLEHLAFHDARTSLPNRAAALRHLASAVDSGAPFSVVTVRLAGFRSAPEVDDATVPTILATAASRLFGALPDAAFLAKDDDDAFIIVLPTGTELPAAVSEVFADPIETHIGNVKVEIESGRAEFPADAGDAEGLLRAAR